MTKLLTIAASVCLLMSCAQKSGETTEKTTTTDTTAAAPAVNTLSAEEIKDGWKLLFDGTSTKGWHSYNKDSAGSAWQVKDGALYLDTTRKEGWQIAGGGDLVNETVLGDFDLKMEWKISKGGNSGIIFYLQEDKKYDYCWLTGPEMQVLDNDGHEDGKITKHRAGDLYDLIKCSKETAKPYDQWNQVEILSQKGKLTLSLNGTEVVNTTMWDDNWKKLIADSKFKDMPDFGKFKSGKIALQDHGHEVAFRNIKVKQL